MVRDGLIYRVNCLWSYNACCTGNVFEKKNKKIEVEVISELVECFTGVHSSLGSALTVSN